MDPYGIYRQYASNKISRQIALETLISLTDQLDSDLKRAECVRYIGRVMPKKQKSFEFLENFSISDEYALVRREALVALVRCYPLQSFKILSWMAENEHSVVVIAKLINLLNNHLEEFYSQSVNFPKLRRSYREILCKIKIKLHNHLQTHYGSFPLNTLFAIVKAQAKGAMGRRERDPGTQDFFNIKKNAQLFRESVELSHQGRISNCFVWLKGKDDSSTKLKTIKGKELNIKIILRQLTSQSNANPSREALMEFYKFLEESKHLNTLEIHGNLRQLDFYKYPESLRKLVIIDAQVQEIKGLEKLFQLRELTIRNSKIKNIVGLTNLRGLKSLNLSGNCIEEIRCLDSLTRLNILNLNSNEIREIRGLKTLTNLEILDLSSNRIERIAGLENLKKLEYLYLENNKIHEIRGLTHLTKLRYLGLRNNNITEIKGLNALKNLDELDLINNPFKKADALRNLAHLRHIPIKLCFIND
ncbi:MAG: hypothetical protein GF383_15140 [Candidatus Lokiarchaeota archaeon]|nr:hypothetical protein [Candidatus Lokiarchaeota archaeon]MBD3342851.1 hypothetical protein [Candidatus Lokiarchaeota archaeon]